MLMKLLRNRLFHAWSSKYSAIDLRWHSDSCGMEASRCRLVLTVSDYPVVWHLVRTLYRRANSGETFNEIVIF